MSSTFSQIPTGKQLFKIKGSNEWNFA